MKTNTEQPPILSTVSSMREQLKKSELNIAELQLQAASQDPNIRNRALKILEIKWQKTPEEETQELERVDLQKFFKEKGYSESEIQMIASQTFALNLINGCNGGCFFCFLCAERPTHKFTFESIKWFLKKYKDFLPHEFSFYWNSDPFEYIDLNQNGDEKTYTDIFQILRDIKPKSYHFISTALPKGSQRNFTEFMKLIAQRFLDSKENSNTLKIRLSVGRHNVERIEATLKILFEELATDLSMSRVEINNFAKEFIGYDDRTSLANLKKVGLIFEQNDAPHRDIDSPVCYDGALIGPTGIAAVIMTATTVVAKSGIHQIEIKPGEIDSILPQNIFIDDYSRFTPKNFLRLDYPQHIMLPRAKTHRGESYHLPDRFDDITLKLGREAFSIMRLIQDIASLRLVDLIDDVDKQKYLIKAEYVASHRYASGLALLRKQIQKHEAQRDAFNESQRKEIEFMIDLLEVYLDKMLMIKHFIILTQDIFSSADLKAQTELISLFATLIECIGKDDLLIMPILVEKVLQIVKEKDNQLYHENYNQDITEMLEELLKQLTHYFSSDILWETKFKPLLKTLSQSNDE